MTRRKTTWVCLNCDTDYGDNVAVCPSCHTHNPNRKKEAVDHPSHYKHGGIEAITVIDAWGLGFCLGNTLKYISRAGHKGDALEDLKKARWYLDHEIERRGK